MLRFTDDASTSASPPIGDGDDVVMYPRNSWMAIEGGVIEQL